jgi:hypothetical protein
MQILSMMSDYVIQKKSSMSGVINTTIMVDNISYPVNLDQNHPKQTIELIIKDTKQTNLQIKTNDNFMVDYAIEYIPQDTKNIQDEMHHVKTL